MKRGLTGKVNAQLLGNGAVFFFQCRPSALGRENRDLQMVDQSVDTFDMVDMLMGEQYAAQRSICIYLRQGSFYFSGADTGVKQNGVALSRQIIAVAAATAGKRIEFQFVFLRISKIKYSKQL